MVTVYIWESNLLKNVWGHASVDVNNTYISWWPEAEGRVNTGIIDKLPDGSFLRNIYSASAIRGRSFAQDKNDEDIRPDSEIPRNERRGKNPDHTIVLRGLDEEAILNWWESVGLVKGKELLVGPMLPWKTLSQNCSTMAATALIKGGAAKYSDWIMPDKYFLWVPDDVRKFALSIQKGLAKSSAKPV